MVAWGANAVRLSSDWSRKGNRKGETLWSLLSNIFNAFLKSASIQHDADLVLGGTVLARGTANIAHQLFGWYPRGWGGGFLAHLHSPWGYDEPEILHTSNRHFGPIGADAGQAVLISRGPLRFPKALERLARCYSR